jgi:anaerobic ribonucleoside-triphosphate reductase activating protein
MNNSSIINVSGIVSESIVDGPGFRFVVFVQGCPHGCPGCHNPHTHSFRDGTKVSVDEIIRQIKNVSEISGVTFSGGEPFEQPIALGVLAERIHELGYDIICYTGYVFEHLFYGNSPEKLRLLRNIDILVDGPFKKDERSIDLKFRGSANQRVLDVKASIESGVAFEVGF